MKAAVFKMELTIRHPYLVFPVNTAKTMKKLLFQREGTPVYESDIRLDPLTPDFYAYLDVRRFIGQKIDLSVQPDMELSCREADSIDRPDLYREPFRPRYHFTEKNGWTNDPNGLVRDAAGTYHMFYQLNPAEPRWGNMHWGHAESPDMIRWTQKEIALFPDSFGTMFSGSGLLDAEGTAGFGKNALLFYYTAAGGSSLCSVGAPFTQCLAYSTDNGKTITKYEGNPVIPHIQAANRDPKIVYCEELSCHVLALYLEGDTYALLTTHDLLHFTLLQTLSLPGDNECPDFYPLVADDGTRRWVFSGAHARYLVGTFRDGRFVPEQEVRSMHTGSLSYAAQTYSTLPDGRRVNVAWETIQFPCGMPFCSQMSLPIVHTLRKKADGYILYAEPAEETASLRTSPLTVKADPDGCHASVASSSVEMILTAPAEGGVLTLRMLGQTVVIDRQNSELRFAEWKLPLEAENGTFTVRLFWDICSLEVFAGSYYACFGTVCDENLKEAVLTGDPNAHFTGYQLASVF